VNEEANQLATGITGSPDNRNFHKRISGYKNLMVFKRAVLIARLQGSSDRIKTGSTSMDGIHHSSRHLYCEKK